MRSVRPAANTICPYGIAFLLQILLVEHEGNLVTREEIKRKLWPNDTIVDFENSINIAIGRLRQALDDSAEEPQYIATMSRRGYRLMVPAECMDASDSFQWSVVERPTRDTQSQIAAPNLA